MAKEKVLKTKEWEKILRNNGFEMVRQNGSHKMYKRGSDVIPVTCHKLNRMVVQRMIKIYNIKVDD